MRILIALSTALLVVACACGDDDDDDATGPDAGTDAAAEDAGRDAGAGRRVSITVAPDREASFESFVAPLADAGVVLAVADDPVVAAIADTADQRIAVVAAEDLCSECYMTTLNAGVVMVRGGAPLGVQYGVAHALERMGLGFFSPFRTHVAADFPRAIEVADPALGRVVTPETRVRGLWMHTLHPIEALYDFLVPGPEALARAELVIDWAVKNRANLIEWVPLDDILASAEALAAFRAHTGALVEHAHLRGLAVGLNVQLYGESNIQNAYDLLDEVGTADEQRAAIEERLGTLLDGLPIDLLVFSFGEFVGTEPAQFIESAGLAAEVALELRPDLELGGLIHVGNGPELRVEWEGESMLYYFLVAFVDPPIVPWVHSVMYYNLFDDAGGAYGHDDFSEHRAFLVDRLRAGEPVAYQPENAYWVAFDDSVPQYLPLYVRSRLRDLTELRAISDAEGIARLDQHVLFSTGWEWGYWQHDWAGLRMGHTLPPDARALFRQMLEHHGAAGRAVADAVADLAEVQHRALIEERLAGYVACSDAIIDLGRIVGIVSQPDPIQIGELVAMTAPEREAFADSVVAGLARLEDDVAAIQARVEAEALGDDPWLAEIRDGVAIDVLRARFAHRTFAAVLASLDGEDGETLLTQAEAALAEAHAVVDRRHAALHYPAPGQITEPGANPTIYPFGYLEKADSLCYWERERVMTANVVRAEDADVPPCHI